MFVSLFLVYLFVSGAWNRCGRGYDGLHAGGDRGSSWGVLLSARREAQEVPRDGLHRGHVEGLGKKVQSNAASVAVMAINNSSQRLS